MQISYPLDNLIPEIVCEDNMYDSFDYVIGHLEYEEQRKKYRPLRTMYVVKLAAEIRSGIFRIYRSDVRDIHVKDGPKERDVQAPTVYKRVGIHAIMVVVERHTYPSLIKNTASSGRG